MAVESERARRLAELRIERDGAARAPDRNGRGLAGIVTLGLLLALILGALGGWYLSKARSSEPIESAAATRAESTARARAKANPAASATRSPVRPSDTTSAPPILNATGHVVARRAATVSSNVTGRVAEVLVDEGTSVTEGQVIARIDDSLERAQLALAEAELASAQAAVEERDAELRRIAADLNRAHALGEAFLSEARIETLRFEADAAAARLDRSQCNVAVAERTVAVQRQRLAEFAVRAPFAGVLVAKTAHAGETVSPISAGGGYTRTGIGTIVDMDSLEVEVDVNESHIDRVHVDQRVTVTLNAHPLDPYPGRVRAVIPAIDRTKATIRVRIALLRKDSKVLPDMGVQVAFFGENTLTSTENQT